MDIFNFLLLVIGFLIMFVPFIGIVIFIAIMKKNKERKSDLITSKIKENDTNFDVENFKEIVKNNLENISKSIMRCDYSGLMSVESKSLYENDAALIKQALLNNHLSIQNMESINSVDLVDYKMDNDFEHVYCKVRIYYRNISLIPGQNKITSADERGIINWKYVDVMRSTKVKTNQSQKVIINRCPNCGAELEVNNLGRCIYCSSYIVNGITSWVINRIEDYYWLGGNEK